LCYFGPANTNQNASALGRLAKGKPKKYSPAEIKRQTALLKKARVKRGKKALEQICSNQARKAPSPYMALSRSRPARSLSTMSRIRWTLGQACQKTRWQMHDYCLMSTHFHLVLDALVTGPTQTL
jgi:hypothetical protein